MNSNLHNWVSNHLPFKDLPLEILSKNLMNESYLDEKESLLKFWRDFCKYGLIFLISIVALLMYFYFFVDLTSKFKYWSLTIANSFILLSVILAIVGECLKSYNKRHYLKIAGSEKERYKGICERALFQVKACTSADAWRIQALGRRDYLRGFDLRAIDCLYQSIKGSHPSACEKLHENLKL